MITDTGYYFCARPDCCVCAGMLARGDFARDVPEVRYDVYGIGAIGGRYDGLSPAESKALCHAIVALGDLCLVWLRRGDPDGEEEPTRVDLAAVAP